MAHSPTPTCSGSPVSLQMFAQLRSTASTPEGCPLLRSWHTLRTRGKDGCNFWLRAPGAAPKTRCLDREGVQWGELRGEGSQTIIWGRHPEGMRYRILFKTQPLPLDPGSIRWPPGVSFSRVSHGIPSHVTERVGGTERTDEERRGLLLRSPQKGESASDNMTIINEVIQLTVPTEERQNHRLLFDLARWVKKFERDNGKQYEPEEMKILFFDPWYEKAKKTGFLRETNTKDDYWFEFQESYEAAKYHLGEKVLRDTWTRTLNLPLPSEASRYESLEVKRLVSWCRQLQLAAGDNPFFLSARTVQAFFRLTAPMQAWRRLQGLRRDGLLEEAEKGTQGENGRATRWRYLPLFNSGTPVAA